jgi:hypothetical protein
MRIKIHGGTPLHGNPSLCTSCSHSLITRGETLGERLVECRVSMMEGRLIPFKVTSCTGYRDASQPSYMELVRMAWILNPNRKKKQAAGFVRGEDLTDREFRKMVRECPDEAPC